MLCVMFRESIRVNLLCFIEVFQYEIIKLYFRRKKYHKFLITQTVKDHIDRYKSKLILDEQFDVGSTEYLMEQKDDTTILLLKPYKYNSNCQDICDVYGVEHLFRFCYYIKEEFARCKTRSKYEERTYCPKGPDLAGDDIFHGFIQFGNLIDLLIKYIHSLSLRSIRNTRVTAKVVMMEGIIWLGSIAGMQQTMSVVRKIAQQWRYGKDNVDSNMYPIPPQISKEHEISNKELIIHINLLILSHLVKVAQPKVLIYPALMTFLIYYLLAFIATRRALKMVLS
ncbi:MAG: hypothetical protein EZS28_012840 [Streblomastix strix]|uniref:Uncharacterized protein n=1 Tax=Streblomastix strix TaxID=222440 RepID=A0A5J4W9L5_9EUKA|nr:MAG: hypothetical protein EZS28_012840 [Streblomastix strix]